MISISPVRRVELFLITSQRSHLNPFALGLTAKTLRHIHIIAQGSLEDGGPGTGP
jgi:hypothetical protein